MAKGIIQLTDSARDYLAKVGDPNVSLSVKGGGCSGFKYNFNFDSSISEDDVVFNRAVIDKASLEIINGSIIDFKVEMIGESFVINNPKASSSCGCGLSFSV